MGIFDFVRNAGAKIGIGKSTDEIAAEEAAIDKAENDKKIAEIAKKRNAARERIKARAAAKRSAENAEKRAEARKSTELEKYVRDMDLSVSGLDIRYDDGTAFIDGEAADSATKEKVILLIGNVEGIAQVDESLTVASDDGADSEMYTVEPGDTLWQSQPPPTATATATPTSSKPTSQCFPTRTRFTQVRSCEFRRSSSHEFFGAR